MPRHSRAKLLWHNGLPHEVLTCSMRLSHSWLLCILFSTFSTPHQVPGRFLTKRCEAAQQAHHMPCECESFPGIPDPLTACKKDNSFIPVTRANSKSKISWISAAQSPDTFASKSFRKVGAQVFPTHHDHLNMQTVFVMHQQDRRLKHFHIVG